MAKKKVSKKRASKKKATKTAIKQPQIEATQTFLQAKRAYRANQAAEFQKRFPR